MSEAPHEVMNEEDQTTGAANQMEEWKKTVIPSDEVLIQDNANALFEAVSGMDLSGADWEISSYGEEHQRYIAIAKKDGKEGRGAFTGFEKVFWSRRECFILPVWLFVRIHDSLYDRI